MCQMKVVLEEEGVGETILGESVTALEVLPGGGVRFSSLFEAPLERKDVDLARIDFLDGRVVVRQRKSGGEAK